MNRNGFLYFNSKMTGAPQISNIKTSIRDIFLACTSIGFGESRVSSIDGRHLIFNNGYSVFDNCIYVVESNGNKQSVKAKQVDINTIELLEDLSIDVSSGATFYPEISGQKAISGIYTDNRAAIELSNNHYLGIGAIADNVSTYIGATRGSSPVESIKINGKWSLLIGRNGAYFKYETSDGKFNLKSIAMCQGGEAYDNTRPYNGITSSFGGAFDSLSRAHTVDYGIITDDVMLNPYAGRVKNYLYIGVTFLPVVSNVTGHELIGYCAASGNLNSERNVDSFIYHLEDVICIMNYEDNFVAVIL